MELPTGDIIKQFGKNDPNAFANIYNHFYQPLVYFANKLIDNIPEAEDIVLDILVKLWQGREHFETATNIKAFLYISVRNRCLNFLDSRIRQKKNKNEYAKVELWDDETERKYLGTNTLDILRQEVEKLPGKCKQVCKLKFYEDLSHEEIAEKLGMNIETVYSHKKRAINLLKIRLLQKKLYNALILLLLLDYESTNIFKKNRDAFADLGTQSCFYILKKPDRYDNHQRTNRDHRKA